MASTNTQGWVKEKNFALRPSHLPEISLHCPATLTAAIAHRKAGASAMAGGSDILLQASHRGSPDHLVALSNIDTLKKLHVGENDIQIGAAVRLCELIEAADIRKAIPAIIDGAQSVGSVQLRRQATIVGNICTASPAADTVPGLLVHDCRVDILDSSGQNRQIALKDFILGPGKVDLKDDELVTGLLVSALKQNQTSAYQRFTHRKALDLAFASVAVRLEYEDDLSTIKSANIALGAVGPTAVDAAGAANLLVGKTLNNALLSKCGEAAAQLCAPISDHRASAEYRRHLIEMLVGDVITQASIRFGNES